MVWQAPEHIQQSKLSRWRALVAWGMLGLMVAAALGVKAGVRAAGRIELGEPIEAGPLAAQVPRAWDVSRDRMPARIWARSEDEGEALLLEISIRTATTYDSPADYLAAIAGEAALEAPRRIRVGGRTGAVVVYGKAVFLPALGVAQGVTATVVAVPLDGQSVLHVELERFGDWNPADATVVQQVAETVRVAGAE